MTAITVIFIHEGLPDVLTVTEYVTMANTPTIQLRNDIKFFMLYF